MKGNFLWLHAMQKLGEEEDYSSYYFSNFALDRGE
jgi:hypothetical protein